jgi:DNA polymerase-3 subunit gamma/tau
MPPERVVDHLSHVLAAENIPFENDALWLLGRAADGSMRDAMSLTDQAIAFGEGKVLAADVRAMLGTLDHGQVYGVLHALIEGDARGLIEAVRHLAEQGPDWNGVLSEMLNVLHRVAIAQALPEAVDNGQGDRERVLELAKVLPGEDVQFYYQMGLIGRRDLPLAPDPRSGFEMVLLRMLAFRPAGSDDVPRVALKPLGISQATADPAPNPVAGAAVAAPAVVAEVAVVAAVAPVATASPLPVPAVAEPPASPRIEPVPPLATTPVPAPVLQPEPVQTVPAVALPWEEQVASPAPVAEAAPNPTIIPEPPAAQPQPAPAALPAVEIASPVEADVDDDEPPPGDYDYVEMDAESIDYDFDAAEIEQSAEPQVLPAAQPATGLAADWLELFPKLGLSGMTGSIGANCALIAVDGDNWLLHLDPGHSALFNPTQQRRLNDALNQHLGRELSLQIELRKPEQETPAQAAARQRANRQRDAEASIHNDPLVQQMIQQFAAVIRADSIEPLDTPVKPLTA